MGLYYNLRFILIYILYMFRDKIVQDDNKIFLSYFIFYLYLMNIGNITPAQLKTNFGLAAKRIDTF